MNVTIVGSRKEAVLDYLTHPFLLIDDGELIDQVIVPSRRAVTYFDISTHSFDPLRNMDYKRARDFIAVLDAVFPEGEDTLTRKNSNFVLLKALLDKPSGLGTLIAPHRDNADAYQKIQTLLLSPVLQHVLTGPTNLSLRGTLLARLDRAALGDFDAFVIANLLISQYKGHVVIPDFGFYATAAHTTLLRQKRLVAGITSFDEVPALRGQLLLSDSVVASCCTAEDAKVLALYEGLTPGTNAYNDYIQESVRGPA